MSEQTESTLDLEQPENQRASSREWWAERIGWVAISIILIAALLGAFGPGPLSHREAASDDGRLRVDYYRVQRYAAPAELRIRFEHESFGLLTGTIALLPDSEIQLSQFICP